VLILFGSAAGALGQPSYMSMLPDLVPPDELTAVVSLAAYSWNSGRVVGPLVGTALAVAAGPAWTVAFNAATFVAMAVAVLMVRQRFVPHVGADADAGVVDRLVDGLRAVRQSTSCSFTIKLLIAFNITMVPFMGLVPIYASVEFDGGTGLTGLISSVQGVGAIIGGVTITMMVGRRRRSDLLVGVLVLCALTMTAYALAPSRVVLVIAVAFLGAAMSGFFISTSTVVQRDAPREHRGRIIATMQASMGVSYGLGLLFIGAIGDLATLRVAFLVGTVCMFVLFWWISRATSGWRAAVDGELRLDDADRILPAR
jgi:predicted MFS family arabinose efflux permease